MILQRLRQLALELAVYGLAGVIARFLNMLLVPLYTRIFAPADYGVMSLVMTTMTVVSIFVVLALDNSAHRWYWDTEDLSDRKSTLTSWAWCQVVVSTLLATGIFWSADLLGRTIVGDRAAGTYFRLAALALPLSGLGAVTTGWLRLQRRPWATMAYALSTNLLGILLTMWFVIVLHRGLRGVYVAQLITASLSATLSVALLRDWLNPRHFRFERLRAMLRFALPLIPAAVAFWIVGFCDRYFVQHYTNTSEVGLYQVGASIASIVAVATGAFQQAWGPFAMSIHKRADSREVYASVLLAYLWLTSVVAVALSLYAPEAIRLLATARYQGATSVVGLLAFGYVMMGLTYIAAIGPLIVKTTAPTGIAVTAAAGLNIVLNILLVPPMGKVGSALATLMSQATVPAYLFYRSQQLYPIPYRFRAALGLLGLSLGLCGIGSVLRIDSLWLGILAKMMLLALFLPALFVLNIVTSAQIRPLLRRSLARLGG